MFNNFKLIGRFLIIAVIILTFPLFTLAQQEGDGDSQPEPALYGEEAGEQVMVQTGDAEDDEGTEEAQPEPVREMKGQQADGQGAARRSRVANAVQKMLQVAERNEGIGTQLREIAREQDRVHEEMEQKLEEVKARKAWVKFFIGPNYGKLKEIGKAFEKHVEQLGELTQLRKELKNQEDAQLFQEKLQVMEQVASELKEQVESARKGFSLFGWLNRWLSR